MIFDELANMLHHVGNQIMLDTCTIFYIQYGIDGMVQNCYILISHKDILISRRIPDLM